MKPDEPKPIVLNARNNIEEGEVAKRDGFDDDHYSANVSF